MDFSVDPSVSEKKNTLFVVDPTQPFVIDAKNMEYGLLMYNLTKSATPHAWGLEEDVVREDVRDGREEVNFRSFIKTETSMQCAICELFSYRFAYINRDFTLEFKVHVWVTCG